MNGEQSVTWSATSFVPVESKLRPPAIGDGLVPRGTIIDRLLDSVETPLVLVSAPPGSGKTVAVGQWDAEDERSFAWMTVDETDNDPLALMSYLLLALQRVEPVDPGVLAFLSASQGSLTDVLLPRLGHMLASRNKPFVLVLDDVHTLTSAATLAIVSTISDNIPPGSQLALVGRMAPPLDWSRLRAKRRLVEVDTAQLRFSFAEAQALLEGAGLQLEPHEVQTLVDKTEGWAAGLYLASLSLSAAAVQRRSVDAFFGGESRIAAYLRDELLAPVDPDDQSFLIRSSILDQLSGPLCDATLGVTDSDARLRRLAATNNMLLMRIDREGRWYRFHRLFADALTAELNRQEPHLVARLHSAASRWLETHSEPERAIGHAIAAREANRAARLIWGEVPALLASGRTSTVERWLDSFTSREVAAHAKLSLTAGWCAILRGRPVDHWLSAAGRGLYEADRKGEAESVMGGLTLLRAVLARNGIVQMAADAQLAARLLSPDELWLCHAGYLDAVATMLTDHLSEADAQLQSVGHLAETLGAHVTHAQAMAQRALLLISRNEWGPAQALVSAAVAVLRDRDLYMTPPGLPVAVLDALVTARAGQHHPALSNARRIISLLAVTADFPTWNGVQSRYVLARTQLILGDTAAARVLLSEATALLSEVPDAVWLSDAVNQTWRQAERLPLGVDAGASALTSAELRVLQYLPTHLSFEQIGRELYISRNTVKTQAIAAYRKLGVTSRAEAVELALMLGLVTK